MIDLARVASTAHNCKNDNLKTHTDYLNDLSSFAKILKKIAESTPDERIKKTFLHRADQALSTRHIIDTNKSLGPLAYCLQMIEIEHLARKHFCNFKPIEEHKAQIQTAEVKKKTNDPKKQQQLAESLKNLREALFFALQDENIIEETQELAEIVGDDINAVTACVKDCQYFAQDLPRSAHPDFFQIWDRFTIMTLRNTNSAIQFFDSATETLIPKEELDFGQKEELIKAISGADEEELKKLMITLPMSELNTDEKIAIAKQAILQESMTPLLVFADCEWFIDLMDEAGKTLISYAKTNQRQAHQQILEDLFKNARAISQKTTKPK